MGKYVYYSPKRKRKYVRKFDYYEAQERYRAGESAKDLAKEYGVTYERVRQVVIPGARERLAAYAESLKTKGRCQRCGKPTSYFAQKSHGSKHCIRCSADLRVTTVRPDELKCFRCKLWLPDDAFGLYKSAKPYRRGRHGYCKKCAARMRRERRHRAVAEGRARTLQ